MSSYLIPLDINNEPSTTIIYLIEDDGSTLSIPVDPDNADYQTYLNSGLTAAVQVLSTSQQEAIAAEAAIKQAVVQAVANLTALDSQMAPMVAQAQTDLATLAASTDPLAPIIARDIEGSLTIAQAVSDILTALQLISTE